MAQEFAKVLRVSGRNDGYIENGEYVISWCVGHLVGLVYPESYDMKYKKWRLEDLPFLPKEYKYDVIDSVRKQYNIVHALLQREDIDRVYWAGDAGTGRTSPVKGSAIGVAAAARPGVTRTGHRGIEHQHRVTSSPPENQGSKLRPNRGGGQWVGRDRSRGTITSGPSRTSREQRQQ